MATCKRRITFKIQGLAVLRTYELFILHKVGKIIILNNLDYHITALKYSAIGIGALFGLMMIAAWTCFFMDYFKKKKGNNDEEEKKPKKKKEKKIKKSKKNKELDVYDDDKHSLRQNDDEFQQLSRSEPIL